MQRWNVRSSMLLTDWFPEAFYLIQRCFSASIALQHSLLESESLETCLLLLLLFLTYPRLKLLQLLFLPAVFAFEDLHLLMLTQHIRLEGDPLFEINRTESSYLNNLSPVCAAPAALCVPAGETSPALSCCSVEQLPLGSSSSYIPLRRPLSALSPPRLFLN